MTTLRQELQHKLFDLGGGSVCPVMLQSVPMTSAGWNRSWIVTTLITPQGFILPGGGPAAAACHLARAICHRAERHLWH